MGFSVPKSGCDEKYKGGCVFATVVNTREEPQCFCQGGSQDWYAGSYWKFGITSKTNGVNGLARFSVPAKGRDGRDKVGYRFTMVADAG